VISADAHTYVHIYIYRRGNRKVILGPAGRALRTRPAGKNHTLHVLLWLTLQLVHNHWFKDGNIDSRMVEP